MVTFLVVPLMGYTFNNLLDLIECVQSSYRYTTKLLQQGYQYHKLRNTFSKFYRQHYDLVSIFNIGFKTFLRQCLSEPEFYGGLVYKFQKSVLTDFLITLGKS